MEFAVDKGNKTRGFLLGGGLGNKGSDYCGSRRIGANVEWGHEIGVPILEVIALVNKEEGREGRRTCGQYRREHSSSHNDVVGGCVTRGPINARLS